MTNKYVYVFLCGQTFFFLNNVFITGVLFLIYVIILLCFLYLYMCICMLIIYIS